MSSLPFPSNDHPFQHTTEIMENSTATDEPPWKRISPAEPPLHMLQMQLANGNVISYAYADLRETRMLSAGYLQLFIFGMQKYRITVEGRNLTELMNLIGMCRIKLLVELGQRNFLRPESSPSIDKITIEELTGP